MISLRYAMLVVLPALLLLSACGGDDDDSGNGDDSSGDSSPSSSNGSSGSSKNSVNISKIKDGGFSTAKVHIEVAGGKDFKRDLEGNGLATSGFALLAFTSDDGSVQLTLNGTDKDEPGGIGLTARQLASGVEHRPVAADHDGHVGMRPEPREGAARPASEGELGNHVPGGFLLDQHGDASLVQIFRQNANGFGNIRTLVLADQR